MKDEAPFDRETLLRTRNAIGREQLRGVLKVMATTSQEEAATVHKLIAEKEFSEVKRIAHGIAGGALSLGANRLGSAARAVEFADPPTPELGQALQDAVSEILHEIERLEI